MCEIFNIDCLEFLKKYEGKKFNLVITDLPYGITDCKWDTKIDIIEFWKLIKKHSFKNTIYIFFCTAKFGYEIIGANPSYFRYDLIWEKTNSVGFLQCNKQPLRKHENIYIFSNPNPSYCMESNKHLRKYSKKLLRYINKPLKEIFDDFGNRRADHFFRHNTLQFGICTKDTYDKLDELYEIKKYEGYKQYEELKQEFKREHSEKTYNPQFNKGKQYNGVKRGSIHSSVYSKTKRIYTEDIKEIRTKRYEVSILLYGKDDEIIHMTQKPTKLLERLINMYSNSGDLVFDPTMGSGTTGRACRNTGREFVGCELNKEIFESAKTFIFQ